MGEFVRYNPINHQPEQLFTPPTRVVHVEAIYLAKQFFEQLVGRTSHDKGALVQLGTELEMIFLSPDIDPAEARKLLKSENPNYQEGHKEKIIKIKKFATDLVEDEHFSETEKMSRIGFEFHTTPGNFQHYLDAVYKLKDKLTKLTKQLNVLPVLYSQHLHISVIHNNFNLIENPYNYLNHRPKVEDYDDYDDSNPQEFLINQVTKSFSPGLPLVVSPDHWDDRNEDVARINDVLEDPDDELYTIEFRHLSHEWAFDPVLNALMSLMALQRSLSSTIPISTHEAPYDYHTAAINMATDPDLVSLCGASFIQTLSRITSQYPQVSTREIPASAVK